MELVGPTTGPAGPGGGGSQRPPTPTPGSDTGGGRAASGEMYLTADEEAAALAAASSTAAVAAPTARELLLPAVLGLARGLLPAVARRLDRMEDGRADGITRSWEAGEGSAMEPKEGEGGLPPGDGDAKSTTPRARGLKTAGLEGGHAGEPDRQIAEYEGGGRDGALGSPEYLPRSAALLVSTLLRQSERTHDEGYYYGGGVEPGPPEPELKSPWELKSPPEEARAIQGAGGSAAEDDAGSDDGTSSSAEADGGRSSPQQFWALRRSETIEDAEREADALLESIRRDDLGGDTGGDQVGSGAAGDAPSDAAPGTGTDGRFRALRRSFREADALLESIRRDGLLGDTSRDQVVAAGDYASESDGEDDGAASAAMAAAPAPTGPPDRWDDGDDGGGSDEDSLDGDMERLATLAAFMHRDLESAGVSFLDDGGPSGSGFGAIMGDQDLDLRAEGDGGGGGAAARFRRWFGRGFAMEEKLVRSYVHPGAGGEGGRGRLAESPVLTWSMAIMWALVFLVLTRDWVADWLEDGEPGAMADAVYWLFHQGSFHI